MWWWKSLVSDTACSHMGPVSGWGKKSQKGLLSPNIQQRTVRIRKAILFSLSRATALNLPSPFCWLLAINLKILLISSSLHSPLSLHEQSLTRNCSCRWAIGFTAQPDLAWEFFALWVNWITKSPKYGPLLNRFRTFLNRIIFLLSLWCKYRRY